MTHDDLLKMLDLEGRETSPPTGELAIAPAVECVNAGTTIPTALRLDDWGMRRGEDVLRENEELQEVLSGVEGWEQQAHAASDFHAAAFEVAPLASL